jgi:ABC-type glycerol-3-phosphate transport system substrate-binding protein
MYDLIYTNEITPSAISTYGGNETQSLAQSGKQIMWWDFESAPAIYDAPDSPIKGKVAFTAWPAGPGGSWGMAHSWGFGVPKFTKYPEAAVAFSKWATLPKQLKDVFINIHGMTPPKTELANDPEVQAKSPFSKFLLESSNHLRFRVIDIPNPLEVHDVIGKVGSFVLTKEKSVQDAAAWGNSEMKKVLRTG